MSTEMGRKEAKGLDDSGLSAEISGGEISDNRADHVLTGHVPRSRIVAMTFMAGDIVLGEVPVGIDLRQPDSSEYRRLCAEALNDFPSA